MKLQRVYFALIWSLLASLTVKATHVRGGEILYDHVSGNTYSVTVHYYVDPSSPAVREYLLLDAGDGSAIDTMPRIEIDTSLWAPCPIVRSVYRLEHTYTGPGTYILRFEDPNRNEDIVNIPSPEEEAFCNEAVLVISPMLGPNNSARFTAPQTAWGIIYLPITHEPLPFDPDDDDLFFELVTPLGTSCAPIAVYQMPTEIVPGPGNAQSIDASSGTYIWNAPQMIGDYVIAIRCTEWRNGTMIGQVTRDMSMCILPGFAGIGEADALDAFTIRPTASSDVFELQMTTPAQLTILDGLGREVSSFRTYKKEALIDLRNRADGVYLVRVVGASGQVRTVRIPLAR